MKSYCISRDMIILGMKSANQMAAFRDAEKLDCKWVRLQIASTVKKYFLLLVIIIIVLWKALKITLPYSIVFVCCHISESYFMGPGFFLWIMCFAFFFFWQCKSGAWENQHLATYCQSHRAVYTAYCFIAWWSFIQLHSGNMVVMIG